MKPFMSKDFLLNTPTASRLYHEYADKTSSTITATCSRRRLPIISSSATLPPTLAGDHYKWRAAACGFSNEFIRTSGDYDRFMAMPKPCHSLSATRCITGRIWVGGVWHLEALSCHRAGFGTKEVCSSDAFKARLIRRFNVKSSAPRMTRLMIWHTIKRWLQKQT